MSKTQDRKLLEDLHSAITKYFSAENAFRRDANGKTWAAKVEADNRLTIITAKVSTYLKQG